MRKYSYLFVFIFLFSVAQAKTPVRLTTLEWDPYAGSQLINKGFTTEIVQKAFQEKGIVSKVSFYPWKTAMKRVEDGEFDAVYSAYYTIERAGKYYFSDPYAESMLLFFTLKGHRFNYNSLADLKGLRIGTTKGFANTPEFDAATSFTKIAADTEKDSLESLLQGKVDLVVLDKYIALSLINRFFASRSDQIVALETPLEKKPLYLMFSKARSSSPGFLQAFNKGLKKIRQSGLYDLILQRHQFMPIKAINLATLEWPPYTSGTFKKGNIVSDIITRIYQISGYEVQIHVRPWARALKETQFGIHDIAFPAYYSDERNKTFTLIPLHISSEVGFMKQTPKIPDTYHSLEDLSSYRIGVVHGYTNRPDFDAADYLTKLKFYSDEEAIRKLSMGGCDLVVIDRRVAAYLMAKTMPGKNLSFMSPLLDSKMLYLAFSPKAPNQNKKILAFRYGLAELKKNGELQEMMIKFNQSR